MSSYCPNKQIKVIKTAHKSLKATEMSQPLLLPFGRDLLLVWPQRGAEDRRSARVKEGNRDYTDMELIRGNCCTEIGPNEAR